MTDISKTETNQTSLNKRNAPAKIVADFLLRDVFPSKYNTFREYMETIKNQPMALFITNIKRHILKNYQPADRAEIYKKLDAVPREIGGSDPWGYHIVSSTDRYCHLYYGRSLSVANQIRKNHLDNWEKFKADNGLLDAEAESQIQPPTTATPVKVWTAPAPTPTTIHVAPKKPLPTPAITTPISYKSGDGKQRAWSKEEITQFLHMKLVEKKTCKQMAKVFNVNMGRVQGLVSQWSNGRFKAQERKMWKMEKEKEATTTTMHIAGMGGVGKTTTTTAPKTNKIHWTDDLYLQFLRFKLKDKLIIRDIAKKMNIRMGQATGANKRYTDGDLKNLVKKVNEEIAATKDRIGNISTENIKTTTPNATITNATDMKMLVSVLKSMTNLMTDMHHKIEDLNKKVEKIDSRITVKL